MKPEFLKKVVEEQLQKIHEVLAVKSLEYVRNNDSMHNFNVGSRMTGKTREEVIYGFALKHHISIADIREDIAKGKLPSKEIVEEKFTDAIIYAILEKASILERIELERDFKNEN